MNLIMKISKFYMDDAEERELPDSNKSLPKKSLRGDRYYLIPKTPLVQGNVNILSLLSENKKYENFKKKFTKLRKGYPKDHYIYDVKFILSLVENLYNDNKETFEDVNKKEKGYTGKKKTYYNSLQKILAYNRGDDNHVFKYVVKRKVVEDKGEKIKYLDYDFTHELRVNDEIVIQKGFNYIKLKSARMAAESSTMSLKSAVDICSALNRYCDFFYDEGMTKESYDKSKAFKVFLEKYKKLIRVFVKSRAISFYARSLEDICATYCIFNYKTSRKYQEILDKFIKFKQEQESVVKPIEDTPKIRENILEYMHLEEDKFINKMMGLIIDNPRNFQIVRYKEVIDNCFEYFCEEKLIEKDIVKKIQQNLFNKNGEMEKALEYNERIDLFSKVLGTKNCIDEYVNLFAISNENKKIPMWESTIAFLRNLIILHHYQQMNKTDLYANTILAKISSKLESLGLTPILYDKNYAIKWFEFDWGFGKLVEEAHTK